MKEIDVVGAVIRGEPGEVLCALRSQQMSMPGLWEFPGGKIEPGEDPRDSLRREIREELGCEVAVHDLVADHTHAYPGVVVRLRTYNATVVDGQPRPSEHAELRWVQLSDLRALNWAPADVPTVEKILSET